MEFLEFIKNMDRTSWIILGVVTLIFSILYIKRSSDIVKKIVLEAICEAEGKFNSGEGQQKLEFAVECIRGNLPFILKLLLTKSTLVTIIEGLLNTISHSFDLGKQVDIKGNDILLPLDGLRVDLGKRTIGVELDTRDNLGLKEVNIDSDTMVYANVKAETDWKNDTETSVEVGIKKKL